MNSKSRLNRFEFRDQISHLPSIARYGQQIEFLLTKEGLNDTTRQLNGLYNYFNKVRMMKFKYDAKQGDGDIYLFAALLFALSKFKIDYGDHDGSKYTFMCMFEFAIAKIKHFNYTMDRLQWNNFLDELKKSQDISFEIGTMSFPTLSNSYNEYENKIVENNLFDPNMIKVESRDLTKIKQILERTDRQLKFRCIESTIYHWFKHSMEDCYENDYLSDGKGIISCEVFINEANGAVKKGRIAKTSVNERGGKIFIEQNSDIEDTHNRVYVRHLNRYAIIEITFDINDRNSSYAQLISYFKDDNYTF